MWMLVYIISGCVDVYTVYCRGEYRFWGLLLLNRRYYIELKKSMNEGDSYYRSFSKLIGTRTLVQTAYYGCNIIDLKKAAKKSKDYYHLPVQTWFSRATTVNLIFFLSIFEIWKEEKIVSFENKNNNLYNLLYGYITTIPNSSNTPFPLYTSSPYLYQLFSLEDMTVDNDKYFSSHHVAAFACCCTFSNLRVPPYWHVRDWSLHTINMVYSRMTLLF